MDNSQVPVAPAGSTPAQRQQVAAAAPVLDVPALLEGVGRKFAETTMRTTPVQPRARDTVHRIIDAARRIGLARGGEPPTLQDIAETANLRLGAVYRYFSSPGDVLRMAVRLWTVKKFDQYRARLAGMAFDSFADLAEDMATCIDALIASDMAEPDVPGRVKLMLMRDYHEIGFAELWMLAGDVLGAMERGGLDTSDPDLRPRLAMAFASAGGFVKMTVLQAPHMRNTPYFRATLRGYLLAPFEGAGVGHALPAPAGRLPAPRPN